MLEQALYYRVSFNIITRNPISLWGKSLLFKGARRHITGLSNRELMFRVRIPWIRIFLWIYLVSRRKRILSAKEKPWTKKFDARYLVNCIMTITD